MKLLTPQISWHEQQPLMAIDVDTSGRIATGGTDHTVKIWKLTLGDDCKIEYRASIDRHEKPVNAVRFSPNGELLASAGDEGLILLWRLNPDVPPSEGELESWSSVCVLRGHLLDVYDLSWFADSNGLASGSVDNHAHVWDVKRAQSVDRLEGHAHFVQGVASDPQGKYVVTMSSDRTCRIHSHTKGRRYKCIKTLSRLDEEKAPAAVGTDAVAVAPTPGAQQQKRLFRDEHIKSFVRRPAWSPDGALLVLPAGQFQTDGSSEIVNTTYVFARNNLNKPILHLPLRASASVCVRFNPCYFQLITADNMTPWVKLPYRLVFAVATLDEVIVYDTQHSQPIALVSNIHYQPHSDLAWSHDGKTLLVSSTDGYVSLLCFAEGELGSLLPVSQHPVIAQSPIALHVAAPPTTPTKPKLVLPAVPSLTVAATSQAEQSTVISAAPSVDAGQPTQEEAPKKRRVALQTVHVK
eukprot:TRINITY_DN6966_c0_g1_i1.p1 TRINITY_DN6966_c0_g1~~TRINITY_DN6966_c0_g1_i1.p1  ORF type:complete len:466 (+),score=62.83 TRINITY_DN6966_c0_g1_i1:81-1478(+)